eukprot:23507-Pyramimonas_sp.AAC.2
MLIAITSCDSIVTSSARTFSISGLWREEHTLHSSLQCPCCACRHSAHTLRVAPPKPPSPPRLSVSARVDPKEQTVAVHVGAVAVRGRGHRLLTAEARSVADVLLHALRLHVLGHVGRRQPVVEHEQLPVPILLALVPEVGLHPPLQGVHLLETALAQHRGVDVAPDPARAVHQDGRVLGHPVQGFPGGVELGVAEPLIARALGAEEMPGVPLVVVANVEHYVRLRAAKGLRDSGLPLRGLDLRGPLGRIGEGQVLSAPLEGHEIRLEAEG